jgi:preprotein translocase subunit SecY
MVFTFNHGRYFARLPQAFIQEFTTRVTNNNGGPMLLNYHLVISYHLLCFIGYGNQKIPVQYVVQRQVILNKIWWVVIDNGSIEAKLLSYADHFAQAIMFIPAALAGLSKSDTSHQLLVRLVICSGFGIICICNFNNCISFILQLRSY